VSTTSTSVINFSSVCSVYIRICIGRHICGSYAGYNDCLLVFAMVTLVLPQTYHKSGLKLSPVM